MKSQRSIISHTTKHVSDTGVQSWPWGTDFMNIYSRKSGVYELPLPYVATLNEQCAVVMLDIPPGRQYSGELSPQTLQQCPSPCLLDASSVIVYSDPDFAQWLTSKKQSLRGSKPPVTWILSVETQYFLFRLSCSKKGIKVLVSMHCKISKKI